MCGELARLVVACELDVTQVDKLYWDGEIVQKARKRDHSPKAEQLWKVNFLQLGCFLQVPSVLPYFTSLISSACSSEQTVRVSVSALSFYKLRYGLQALEENGVQLTRAAAATEKPATAGKPVRQNSRPTASSMDPRARQQIWKLANPPPGNKAARDSRRGGAEA